MDSCILCLKSHNAGVESINANSIEWKELEIQNIIEKHFWDMQTVQVSSWLCCKCWAQLQDFHKFYISIEDAHIQFGTFMTIEVSQEPELKDEVLIDETMLPNLFSERPEYIMKEELPKFEWDDSAPLIRKSKRLQQATKKVEDIKQTSKMIKKKASNKMAKISQENPTLELVTKQPQNKHIDSIEINNDADSTTDENDDSNTDFNYEAVNKNQSFVRTRPPNQALDKFISENFELKCVLCDIPMETYHVLCDHFESEHQQRGYAVCCDKKFIRRYLLYDHLIQHLNPNYLKCFYCGKTFKNRQILKAHTKKQHKNLENNSANTTKEKFTKKETCKQAEIKHKHDTQEVNGESNDDFHIKNDNDEFDYDYDTGFNNEFNFNNNRPSNKVMDTFIAENYKLTCALCDIPMETYRSLCDHFESEHKLRGYAVCCNKKFIRRYLLYDHLKHHLDSNYLKCYYCGKVLANRQILKLHSKQHQNNRNPSRIRPLHHEMDEFITENFNLKCVICDIPMETFQKLSYHFESVHQEPAYAMCCDKKLLRRYLLFEHIKQHLDPNYLKCNYCGRTFTRRQILKAHRKTHEVNREKNNCCEVCGLCFSNPHVLGSTKTCSKCGNKEDMNNSISLPSTNASALNNSNQNPQVFDNLSFANNLNNKIDDLKNGKTPKEKNEQAQKMRKQIKNFQLENNYKRILPKHPISDLKEFKKFENMLSQSVEDIYCLEKDMSSINFRDHKKYIRYIWSKIISDNLAKHCSWRGSSGKYPISTSYTTIALRGAFNKLYKEDKEEIKTITCKWFHNANARIKQLANKN